MEWKIWRVTNITESIRRPIPHPAIAAYRPHVRPSKTLPSPHPPHPEPNPDPTTPEPPSVRPSPLTPANTTPPPPTPSSPPPQTPPSRSSLSQINTPHQTSGTRPSLLSSHRPPKLTPPPSRKQERPLALHLPLRPLLHPLPNRHPPRRRPLLRRRQRPPHHPQTPLPLPPLRIHPRGHCARDRGCREKVPGGAE